MNNRRAHDECQQVTIAGFPSHRRPTSYPHSSHSLRGESGLFSAGKPPSAAHELIVTRMTPKKRSFEVPISILLYRLRHCAVELSVFRVLLATGQCAAPPRDTRLTRMSGEAAVSRSAGGLPSGTSSARERGGFVQSLSFPAITRPFDDAPAVIAPPAGATRCPVRVRTDSPGRCRPQTRSPTPSHHSSTSGCAG